MTRIVRGALALALACATVACSSGEAAEHAATTPAAAEETPATPGSPGPPDQAVTLDEARDALDTHLATDDVVRAALADRWALALTRDGHRMITLAAIHSHGGDPPRYSWGRREVYVPRQSPGRSPQWFLATAERRDPSGETRLAVLVFARQGERARWQVSHESLLYPEEGLPEIALDDDGYATALDPRDQSVAVSPNLMGPLHATIAEEGPQGFASGLIAPGPHTTGFYAEIEETRRTARERDCMNYRSIFALAARYPVFALRTADGGALVAYTLVRTSTWSPGKEQLKCGEGRPVPIPPEARWLLGAGGPIIREERQIQETQQYVAAVPPKASTAPAHVIGYEGAVSSATNR